MIARYVTIAQVGEGRALGSRQLGPDWVRFGAAPRLSAESAIAQMARCGAQTLAETLWNENTIDEGARHGEKKVISCIGWAWWEKVLEE